MNTNPNTIRILCYGDSNTWGWIPGKMGKERFPTNIRWTGILQLELGENFEVIEEALGARTTNMDDPRPGFGERNGLKSLTGILESQLPVNYFVLMLGTTDTKELFGRSASDISKAIEEIIDFVLNFKTVNNIQIEKFLLIAPPIVDETTEFASGLFKGATQKGEELVELLQEVAKNKQVLFLNSNDYIKVDPNEGVHMGADSHERLGKAVAKVLSE